MKKRVRIIVVLSVLILLLYVFSELVRWTSVKYTNWKRLSEIEKVDPRSYQIFSKFIADIESETGWSVLIISGWRSKEKQKELIRENSKNASSEKSRHVLGRAIDINLYKRDGFGRIWLKKFNSKKDWRNTGVVKISTRYKLLWGGSYQNYHDPVHFEIK